MKKVYYKPCVVEINIALVGMICVSNTPEVNPTNPEGVKSVCARKLYI